MALIIPSEKEIKDLNRPTIGGIPVVDSNMQLDGDALFDGHGANPFLLEKVADYKRTISVLERENDQFSLSYRKMKQEKEELITQVSKARRLLGVAVGCWLVTFALLILEIYRG